MPRPLVVGNGNLLVAFDSALNIRDLYWPYTGLFNHLSGHRARLGFWLDGHFAWNGDNGWEIHLAYVPHSLVTVALLEHAGLEIGVEASDLVWHREDVLLRRLVVHNRADRARECRVFFTHDFHIAETDIGDTALFNPFLDAMVHYKWGNYLLIGAAGPEGGIYQYAAGVKGFGGAEGTWRDAEDGELSGNGVAQGSVDSTIGVRAGISPGGSARFHAWICAGSSMEDVERRHHALMRHGFDAVTHETCQYWHAWSDREADRLAELPEPVANLFRRSLLAIRTNIDNRGAILAANDSDIMETARAHYSYMWPRDGALVAAALDRLGYQELTRRFFRFCCKALPKERPALLHKYSADGSWGSTWHPWIVDGRREVPIQEDSTALTVWALCEHHRRFADLEFLEPLYHALLLPCALFLADYRDPATGLPLPSYDLWEERRGIHAYTCGTVFGALAAAAEISEVFDDGHARRLRTAAEELRAGVEAYLWDESHQRFVRRLVPSSTGKAGEFTKDLVIDSAVHALFAFGMFEPRDLRIESTMRSALSRLWVKTEIGGIARYENDYYFRQSPDADRIPGNPWIICTLWAAQWYVARARELRELESAMELLLWTTRRAMPSGILPEQVHPDSGRPLSVAPLTWSHAEFVATVLDYLDKRDALAS